jgi:uncharacterized protein (TIGR04255 family)
MTDNYSITEIYPNSPLIEVVCEIRFPAELSIEEFLRIFKLLTDLFNIKKLTRLGWQ